MDLSRIDLNLLLVLHRLLQERHVSRSAAALGLTQPAVSNALRRLRSLLGDDLLVRTAGGMRPTPYAERLAGPLAQALGALEGALSTREQFDPAASERRFTLADHVRVDGASHVRLFGNDIPVRSKIHVLNGLSAHADRNALLGWARNFREPPRKSFVVHGEEQSAQEFASSLQSELGWEALAPLAGSVFQLGEGGD